MGASDYEPVDAIKTGTIGALAGGGFGLAAAAIQSALAKQNVGFFGAFTVYGRLITGIGATGGAILGTTAVTSNLREKNDWKSWATGGFAGGAVQGFLVRSMPKVFGYGAGFAILLGVGQYTGGIIGHQRVNTNPDEYEDKERMRKTRRRPIEETLAFVGEGRGVKPPGYEERRAQRLKEKYGVEIKTVPAIATD